MARILVQFDEELDVETLDAATVERIAQEAKVDVQKIEKLKAAWAEAERPKWTVDLVEQALSGYMFVAGVWKMPSREEAEQAEEMAKAKRQEADRAASYAVSMKAAAENAILTREYQKDPAAYIAKQREAKAAGTFRKLPPLPGGIRSAGNRRETTFADKLAAGTPESAIPGAPGSNSVSGAFPPEGTPPDIANSVDRGPDRPRGWDAAQAMLNGVNPPKPDVSADYPEDTYQGAPITGPDGVARRPQWRAVRNDARKIIEWRLVGYDPPVTTEQATRELAAMPPGSDPVGVPPSELSGKPVGPGGEAKPNRLDHQATWTPEEREELRKMEAEERKAENSEVPNAGPSAG